MSKAKSPISQDAIRQYDRIIATVPGVQRKGAASAYTSRNGHMFSFLMPEGPLALRLPDDEKVAFEKKHKSGPCIQHGAAMRGYVVVPDSLFKRTSTISKLFKLSYEYTGTLKPKATTKKKTAAKKAVKKKAFKKKR